MIKRILSVVAVLSMVLSLVGANTASALTSADIAMLQAAGIISASQAASLMASIGGSTTTTSSGYTFTRDLTIGSKGNDVSALQSALVNGGFLVMPAGVAMGYFGALTQAALVKYQLSKGITPAAGYFGPKTRASMGSVTGGTTYVPTGSDLAVALAVTSPMAGSIVSGQAAAGLADYTFTNKSATPAIVTNVTLQRGGVSSDVSLANVYLYNGAVRLTDSATVSSGKITFNAGMGLFTVAPGASITVSVKADILTGLNGGTVNVALTGVTANVPVAGVYPISGSSQTIIATPSDLAGVTLASTSVSTAVDAGTMNQTVWGSTFTLTGRSVWLKGLAVKVIGSIPSDALQNLKLYVSGIQVGSAYGIDSNGMVTFDLSSNPYKIDSSRNLEIRADIINGSTRTFSVSLQNKSDINVIDSNYNVGVSVAGTLPTTLNITINGGTLAASLDTTLSSSDVVLGSTGVSLAKYTIKGYGENVKVSYLNVASTKDLTNVTLYANGSSISSSQNVASTSATLFSLGSSLIINAGQTVTLEIRGDLKNSAGTNIATGTQVYVTLSSYTNNAQGSYSSQLTTFPSSAIVGPTMTVVGGTLSVAKNAAYNNTTLTANTPNFKIGSFILSSNSSEPVRVTGLTVALGGTFPLTSLSNLYTSVNSTKVNPQLSNNFGTDFTIAANSSKVIDVYADIGSGSTTASLLATTSLTVTANGVNSNADASSGAIAGQTLTIGNGSVATPTLKSTSPISQLVLGGTTGTAGIFNFVASVGNATINELGFTIASTTYAGITSITVGGVTRAVAVGATTTVTGLNISVPVSNAGTDVPVSVTYNTVGNNGVASNASSTLSLASIKFTSGNVSTTTYPVVSANPMTPVAGYPTITIAAGTRNGLTNGPVKLADVTISASGNTVNVTSLPITVAQGDAADVSSAVITIQDGNTVVGSTTSNGAIGANTLVFNNGGYQLSAGQSKTFSIYATASAVQAGVGTDSLVTSLGSALSVAWNDVEGGATGLNAAFIPSYSTTDTSTVNNN